MHNRFPPLRTRAGRAVAALLLTALTCAVATAILFAGPATAATTGAGVSGITPYGGYLGNYIAPDGTRVYCVDANLDWPSGQTGPGVRVDALTTSWGEPLDATTMRKLNYALLTWGQTADPALAAAVSAYLYAYTSGYARTHGAGYAAGAHYINGDATVLAVYDSVWSAAEAQFAGTLPTATVDVALDGRTGTVDVTVSPEDSHATLSLSGATVEGSDATSVEVSDGSTIAVRSTAPEEATSVTVDATVEVQVARGAAPELILYTTPGQQRTVRAGAPETLTTSARDSATVELRRAPAPELAQTGLGVAAPPLVAGGVLLTAGLLAILARTVRPTRRGNTLRHPTLSPR